MIIKSQFDNLVKHCLTLGCDKPQMTPMPNGGILIQIGGIKVEGWNRPTANILFLAPPGFPQAPPDCFWVEPGEFRLANNGTPENSSDSNPYPGDERSDGKTTWFSWHVQSWNPNRDTLITFFKVIQKRLTPAR